jgi:hypothetical protein
VCVYVSVCVSLSWFVTRKLQDHHPHFDAGPCVFLLSVSSFRVLNLSGKPTNPQLISFQKSWKMSLLVFPRRWTRGQETFPCDTAVCRLFESSYASIPILQRDLLPFATGSRDIRIYYPLAPNGVSLHCTCYLSNSVKKGNKNHRHLFRWVEQKRKTGQRV